MGKRCVAAGCSNTNADGVSLFRFPSKSVAACVNNGINTEVQRLVPIGRMQPNILFFVANILPVTASKRTLL